MAERAGRLRCASDRSAGAECARSGWAAVVGAILAGHVMFSLYLGDISSCGLGVTLHPKCSILFLERKPGRCTVGTCGSSTLIFFSQIAHIGVWVVNPVSANAVQLIQNPGVLVDVQKMVGDTA